MEDTELYINITGVAFGYLENSRHTISAVMETIEGSIHTKGVSIEDTGHTEGVSIEDWEHTKGVSTEDTGHTKGVSIEDWEHIEGVAIEHFGHTEGVAMQIIQDSRTTVGFTGDNIEDLRNIIGVAGISEYTTEGDTEHTRGA
jgi:hypothetical protein